MYETEVRRIKILSPINYALNKLKNKGITNEPKLATNINMISTAEIYLQQNLGNQNDCSITSIAALLKYSADHIDFQQIYLAALHVAEHSFFHRARPFGMLRFFIKSGLEATSNLLGLFYKTNVRYLKDIFFDYEDIQYLVDQDQGVILSFREANDGTYRNHSLVIIGYVVYLDRNSGESLRLLAVNDLMTNKLTYLDYDSISRWSQINFIRL